MFAQIVAASVCVLSGLFAQSIWVGQRRMG